MVDVGEWGGRPSSQHHGQMRAELNYDQFQVGLTNPFSSTLNLSPSSDALTNMHALLTIKINPANDPHDDHRDDVHDHHQDLPPHHINDYAQKSSAQHVVKIQFCLISRFVWCNPVACKVNDDR